MRFRTDRLFEREVPLFTNGSSPNLKWSFSWGSAQKWRGSSPFESHRGVRGGPQRSKISSFSCFLLISPKTFLRTEIDLPQPLALPNTRRMRLTGPFLHFGKKCYGRLNVRDHVAQRIARPTYFPSGENITDMNTELNRRPIRTCNSSFDSGNRGLFSRLKIFGFALKGTRGSAPKFS